MSATGELTPLTSDGSTPPVSRFRRFVDFCLGRPLATREGRRQKLGAILGVPALGLDALCSSAYGPEAALTVLMPFGRESSAKMVPITALIVGLAFIVYFSYRQTLAAYPTGGGSYTVARQNLGRRPGLVAAAALACDYVLNVAVGVAAGVGALVSALPVLLPHILPLCLAILGVLVLVNLRGTRDASLAFLLPTCLFVGTLFTVILIGGYHAVLAGGHPTPVVPPPLPRAPSGEPTTWLLVLAFASGCTAMTGIEAVSNGVTAFREPRTRNAQGTLTLIVGILVFLLLGIALLCRAYGVQGTVPDSPQYESVLSQITAAVVGRGPFYYVTLGSVVVLLCLSANTSFADFPRLCSVLARDGYLPDFFALRGRRLVFSAGVISLALLSGALLVTFGGVTHHLIPLFAVGAFTAFTLSQAGMVAHWRSAAGPRRWGSLTLNFLGMVATGATAIVVAVSKFSEGAWIAIVALSLTALVFAWIHRHYARASRELDESKPLDPSPPPAPVVVVPVQGWDKLTSRSLRFARRLSDDIHALHVLAEDSEVSELTASWESLVAEPARASGARVPELVLRSSPYREFFTPIIEYVNHLHASNPGRDVVVVIPSVVPRRLHEALLHNERGALLKALLRLQAPEGVIVVSVPYRLAH